MFEARIGPVIAEMFDDIVEERCDDLVDIPALEVRDDDDSDSMQMGHIWIAVFPDYVSEYVFHEIIGVAYLFPFFSREWRMETDILEKRLLGLITPEAIQKQ